MAKGPSAPGWRPRTFDSVSAVNRRRDWVSCRQLCGECDALSVPATSVHGQTANCAIISTSVVAAVVLASALGVIVTHRSEPETSLPPTSLASAAMQQWWSGAHEHVDELHDAIDDSRRALEGFDESALKRSCPQMHDASTVKLQAHLPAPDTDLNAELEAAMNDVHAAAHVCLAALAGSQNNYAGEFVSNLEEAERRLEAAQDIVNKSLLTA